MANTRSLNINKQKNRSSKTAVGLEIISPRSGDGFGADLMEVRLRLAGPIRNLKDKLTPQLTKEVKIELLVDGKKVFEISFSTPTKSNMKVSLQVKTLAEGLHELKARIKSPRQRGTIPEMQEPLVVPFTIDRTPPVILSVFPSNNVIVQQKEFRSIVITAEDSGSGIDPKRCSVSIGSEKNKEAVRHRKGLVFKVGPDLEPGQYKIKATIFDHAGNSVVKDSAFEVVSSENPDDRAAQEEIWKQGLEQLNAKISDDTGYKARMLAEPRKALAELGLPFPTQLSQIIPSIPREQAEFLSNTDGEEASKNLSSLLKRLDRDAGKVNVEEIKSIFGNPEPTEVLVADGQFSAGTKKALASLLADPLGILKKLGVTPTKEEAKYIVPAFPPLAAEAFSDWVSMMHSGNFPVQPGKQERKASPSSSQVGKEDTVRWLSNPVDRYKEMNPTATARELLALPAPVSKQEAVRLMSTVVEHGVTKERKPHNSSDLITGVSISGLSKAFLKTTAAVFPLTRQENDVPTGLPTPWDRFTYSMSLNQPSLLKIKERQGKKITTSVGGNARIAFPDGSEYAYRLNLTAWYNIDVDSNTVFFDFYELEVEIVNEGTGPGGGAETAIIEFIQQKVREVFPQGRTPLLNATLQIPVLPADLAIDLHRIAVYNDQDSDGSGECYFEFNLGGTKFLLGQFDVESGGTVELNRTYLLNSGGNNFSVSVKGMDRDWGWPDRDDSLGEGMQTHSAESIGRYALSITTLEVQYELIWTIIDFVWTTICWVVEVLVAILNWFLSICGFKKRIETHCRAETEAVMGWIRQAVSVRVNSFTFEYSVRKIYPQTITSVITGTRLDDTALYFASDYAIPGVADRNSKTDLNSFVGKGDVAFAISENLIDKLFRFIWLYGSIPKTLSTDLSSLSFHATVDLGPPNVSLMMPKSVLVDVSFDGFVAGLNIGPAHSGLGGPSSVQGYINCKPLSGKIRMTLEKILFSGSNFETAVLQFLSSFYNAFNGWFAKQFDLFMEGTVKVGDGFIAVSAAEPFKIQDNEFVMNLALNINSQVIPESTKVKEIQLWIGGPFEDIPNLLLVANKSKGHLELHRKDCRFSSIILQKNRTFIFGTSTEVDDLYRRNILPQAKFTEWGKKGYDGCYYCLHEKHTA